MISIRQSVVFWKKVDKSNDWVKPGYVTEMLDEHGWNNKSTNQSDQELMQNLTGSLGVEEL